MEIWHELAAPAVPVDCAAATLVKPTMRNPLRPNAYASGKGWCTASEHNEIILYHLHMLVKLVITKWLLRIIDPWAANSLAISLSLSLSLYIYIYWDHMGQVSWATHLVFLFRMKSSFPTKNALHLHVPSYFPSCTYQDRSRHQGMSNKNHIKIKDKNILKYHISPDLIHIPHITHVRILPPSSWRSIPAAVSPHPRAAARVCQRAAMPRSGGDDRPRHPRGTRLAERWDLATMCDKNTAPFRHEIIRKWGVHAYVYVYIYICVLYRNVSYCIVIVLLFYCSVLYSILHSIVLSNIILYIIL